MHIEHGLQRIGDCVFAHSNLRNALIHRETEPHVVQVGDLLIRRQLSVLGVEHSRRTATAIRILTRIESDFAPIRRNLHVHSA